MLSVGFNVETVMLCSLADLPQNTSPCMKVIGPVGNPESTLQIPGLVPVDYESGFINTINSLRITIKYDYSIRMKQA